MQCAIITRLFRKPEAFPRRCTLHMIARIILAIPSSNDANFLTKRMAIIKDRLITKSNETCLGKIKARAQCTADTNKL